MFFVVCIIGCLRIFVENTCFSREAMPCVYDSALYRKIMYVFQKTKWDHDCSVGGPPAIENLVLSPTKQTNKQKKKKKKKKKGIIVHFLGPCDTPAFPTEKTSCIATVFSLTYQKVKQYRVPCVITILLCSSRRCFSSKPKGLFMHIQLSKSVKSLCDRGRVFEHSLKAAPTIKHITEQPYLTS